MAIGAGVDIALASRYGWGDFVASMAKEGQLSQIDRLALRRLLPSLPTEIADALRVALGRSQYEIALQENTRERELTDKELGPALQALVDCGIRLILNFNYTRDVLQTLTRNSREITHEPRQIIAIQRFHLEGWSKRDLLEPQVGEIHHISIHGMADSRFGHLPPIVLDRKSYNQAFFGDLHYSDVLSRILQDYTVLSIGLSWEDVVLRSAAARVHFTNPISGRVHVALMPATDESEKQQRSSVYLRRVDTWRERAFVSAYSVRPIYYSPRERHRDLSAILGNIPKMSKTISDALSGETLVVPSTSGTDFWTALTQIADVLDECGDYESLFHRQWFAYKGNWKQLHRLMVSGAAQPSSFTEWMVLSRIERHLRHFVWVYEKPRNRDASRVDAWERIAQYWKLLDETETQKRREEFDEAAADGQLPDIWMRGLFEYALGAFEVYGQSRRSCSKACREWQQWLVALAKRNRRCNVSHRVGIARGIWIRQKPPLPKLEELRRSAIKGAWEGMEAKIALDICESYFEAAIRPRNRVRRRKIRGIDLRSHPQRDFLTGVATDAWETARMAGCGRRELGAMALASLVAPPEQAEADLVGVLHAVSKRVEAGAGPVGDWGIYTGLLATLLDRTQQSVEPKAALGWLQERCGTIRIDAQTDVPAALARYWRAYRADAATLAEQVAALIKDYEPAGTRK